MRRDKKLIAEFEIFDLRFEMEKVHVTDFKLQDFFVALAASLRLRREIKIRLSGLTLRVPT
ncbi:MAG: hypothetical protein QM802_14245 [Agriterribacter sp.]